MATKQKAKPETEVEVEEEEQTEVEGEENEDTQGFMMDDGDDDSIVVDMTGVDEAAGFELVPKGIYNCTIDDVEFKRSQNGNNPMWAIRLEIEDGEHQGRKLFTHVVFSAKSAPFAKKAMTAFCPELVGTPFKPNQIAAEGELVGRRLRARVTHRKWEGEMRSNVAQLLPASAGDGFVE